MSSSNPFRRKPSDRLPTLDTGDTSGTSSPSTGLRDETSPEPPAGPATDDKKTKPVKKVRVLSPPPLSPDSPEWPYSSAVPTSAAESFVQSAAAAAATATEPGGAGLDPFEGSASIVDSDRDSSTATPPPPQLHSQPQPRQQQQQQQNAQPHSALPPQALSQVPPANPFSKTLHDLENAGKDEALHQERQDEGAALKAGNAARKSLNVDSFRQLLMTGNTEISVPKDDAPTSGLASPAQGTVLTLDSSTVENTEHNEKRGVAETRLSPPLHHKDSGHVHHDDHDDNHESNDDFNSDSNSSADVQIGSRGKKAPPPPPSSRHGRSLTQDLKNSTPQRPGTLQRTPSDLNKALPPPPAHSLANDDAESPFDREAAGKVPDWEPMLSPQPASNNGGKKAVPAPPPRRGHARGESRSQVPTANSFASQAAHKAVDDEPASLTPSRSSSIRHSVPAPPPPRRPLTQSRQISSSSPTAASFTISPLGSPPTSHPDTESHAASLDDADFVRDLPQSGSMKLSAPPPPPKRNTSVRRPQSIQSVDAISRRIPRSDGSAPPPPPPRARGSSRSSMDGPPRRLSSDSFVKLQPSLTAPQPHTLEVSAENIPPTAPGKGVDILADLTALQREVDALRGKLH